MWQNYSGRLLVALKMRHGTTLIGWCCRRTYNLSDNVRLRPIRRLQDFFIFGVGVRDPSLGGEGGVHGHLDLPMDPPLIMIQVRKLNYALAAHFLFRFRAG